MKKILILIILIFLTLLTSGCYDNVELNDLDIVVGVGIDYVDDLYEVTFEILNNNISSEEETLKSYTLEDKGKTLSEAFTKISNKTSKTPYLAHLKAVIISENIINGQLNHITDYLIRENIRESFNLIVAKNASPKEILQNTSDDIPVASMYIVDIIENAKYNNNIAINETYEKIFAKLASKDYDIILNSVSLNDKKFSLAESYIFDNYLYKDTLTEFDSSLYNLLTENDGAMMIERNYEKGNVNISLTNFQTDIKVTKDKIIVSVKLEGKVIENNADFNLKDEKDYEKLNKDFEEDITKDIKNFIKTLQQNKSDILGLADKYYKSTRKSNDDLWTVSDIIVNVDLKINTKGFIFEVDYEK